MEKEVSIIYRKNVDKFLEKNKKTTNKEKIRGFVFKFLKKYFWKIDVNIDFKELKNFWKKWEKFFRIKDWNLRIIFQVENWEIILVDIHNVDFRWWVYKN